MQTLAIDLQHKDIDKINFHFRNVTEGVTDSTKLRVDYKESVLLPIKIFCFADEFSKSRGTCLFEIVFTG